MVHAGLDSLGLLWFENQPRGPRKGIRAVDAVTNESRLALARGARLSTDKQTGEPLLLFPEGVVHLSSTALSILQHCDGRATLGVILETLAAEFDADPDVLRADVLECLSQLRGRKLVVVT